MFGFKEWYISLWHLLAFIPSSLQFIKFCSQPNRPNAFNTSKVYSSSDLSVVWDDSFPHFILFSSNQKIECSRWSCSSACFPVVYICYSPASTLKSLVTIPELCKVCICWRQLHNKKSCCITLKYHHRIC